MLRWHKHPCPCRHLHKSSRSCRPGRTARSEYPARPGSITRAVGQVRPSSSLRRTVRFSRRPLGVPCGAYPHGGRGPSVCVLRPGPVVDRLSGLENSRLTGGKTHQPGKTHRVEEILFDARRRPGVRAVWAEGGNPAQESGFGAHIGHHPPVAQFHQGSFAGIGKIRSIFKDDLTGMPGKAAIIAVNGATAEGRWAWAPVPGDSQTGASRRPEDS